MSICARCFNTIQCSQAMELPQTCPAVSAVAAAVAVVAGRTVEAVEVESLLQFPPRLLPAWGKVSPSSCDHSVFAEYDDVSAPIFLSNSGDILSLRATGPWLGSYPHVPVWHHLPPDFPPQLFHNLLCFYGVCHGHLPPCALCLFPAAPHQWRPSIPTDPK